MRLVVGLLLVAASLGAQARPEVRLDVVGRDGMTSLEAGVGAEVMAGSYLRTGLFVSHDVWQSAGDRLRGSVEGRVRFLLDPLGASRWGLSFAGGIGVRGRPYMTLAADLEGPRMGNVRPAVHVALGAGLHAGVTLRGARARWR